MVIILSTILTKLLTSNHAKDLVDPKLFAISVLQKNWWEMTQYWKWRSQVMQLQCVATCITILLHIYPTPKDQSISHLSFAKGIQVFCNLLPHCCFTYIQPTLISLSRKVLDLIFWRTLLCQACNIFFQYQDTFGVKEHSSCLQFPLTK